MFVSGYRFSTFREFYDCGVCVYYFKSYILNISSVIAKGKKIIDTLVRLKLTEDICKSNYDYHDI